MGVAGDPVTVAKAIVDPSLPRLEKSQQFMLKLRDVLQVIAVSFSHNHMFASSDLENTSVHLPFLQF